MRITRRVTTRTMRSLRSAGKTFSGEKVDKAVAKLAIPIWMTPHRQLATEKIHQVASGERSSGIAIVHYYVKNASYSG